MNNYLEMYDFCVTENVRKAFEVAVLISEELGDEELRTSHLLLGLIKAGDISLGRYFFEYGLIINPEIVLKSIICTPELFEDIYGKEAAEAFFEQHEEVKEVNIEEVQEKEKKQPEKQDLKEYIAETVKNTLLEERLNDECEEYVPYLELPYSEDLKSIINAVLGKMQESKSKIMDGDNLIYEMLNTPDCSAYKLLSALIVTTGTTLEEFTNYMKSDCIIYNSSNKKILIPTALESCCEIFNERFEKGEISDILGRDKDKEQLWNIFSKKTKKNAILVGNAGVGKTAIIEAITQDIINETCPKRFKDYIVLSFDVGASVAGTKYRGEFEQKISTLKKFLEQNKNVILFIDEIHSTVGAGAVEGNANDLSGSLKSILARGDVIVVGTTTYEEYDKFIAKDTAYKRRFERVNVREPKYFEVKKMIKLKVERLEQFHGVKMSNDVLNYIITASACFSSSSSNPDKSLDLCDRAMAIAESSNSLKVTKKHVQKVFEDSYQKFKKVDDITNEITAYHEAAHYVVSKITGFEEKENVIAVSILPTNDSLGINILEANEAVVSYSKQDYLDKITVLLAGRAVETSKFERLGSGAESDIRYATLIARNLIVNRSLDFSLNNYNSDISPSFYDENGNEILKLDENTKVKINDEVAKILNDQFKVAKELVDIFSDRIEAVAKALLSKYILTRDELDKIYSSKSHGSSKKETVEVRQS